jgi:hypothetical protein
MVNDGFFGSCGSSGVAYGNIALLINPQALHANVGIGMRASLPVGEMSGEIRFIKTTSWKV